MATLASSPARSSSAGGLLSIERLKSAGELAARLLLSSLFLYSALAKIQSYAGVAAYMSTHGVHGSLLPLVITTEVLFPIALIIGWKTRIATFLLLGYSILAASIFHHNFADSKDALEFFLDMGLIAALLLLLVHGAGPFSLDHRLAREQP